MSPYTGYFFSSQAEKKDVVGLQEQVTFVTILFLDLDELLL